MAQDVLQMEKKRNDFLDAGFRLFSERSIESVTLPMVAAEAGYGTATLYRYFDKKPGFVVAVAAAKWGEYLKLNRGNRPKPDFTGMTAAQVFDFYLESFLKLYRDHKDMLRFNHFFNVYIQSVDVDESTMKPYRDVMAGLSGAFHVIYEKALEDHSIRTDITEEEMFSTTLHLMLAVLTRYAVGLVYKPPEGFDDQRELDRLKHMLMREFVGDGSS
jgi:AcrR family transcriptional regulator